MIDKIGRKRLLGVALLASVFSAEILVPKAKAIVVGVGDRVEQSLLPETRKNLSPEQIEQLEELHAAEEKQATSSYKTSLDIHNAMVDLRALIVQGSRITDKDGVISMELSAQAVVRKTFLIEITEASDNFSPSEKNIIYKGLELLECEGVYKNLKNRFSKQLEERVISTGQFITTEQVLYTIQGAKCESLN